jgi:hypothetical protein
MVKPLADLNSRTRDDFIAALSNAFGHAWSYATYRAS